MVNGPPNFLSTKGGGASNNKSSSGCHYAKDINVVTNNFISKTLREEKNIKVVVACCHSKRFNESLPNLLAWAQDSRACRS